MPEGLKPNEDSPDQLYSSAELVKFGIIGSVVVASVAEVLGEPTLAMDALAVAIGGVAIKVVFISGAQRGWDWLEKKVDRATARHQRPDTD